MYKLGCIESSYDSIKHISFHLTIERRHVQAERNVELERFPRPSSLISGIVQV